MANIKSEIKEKLLQAVVKIEDGFSKGKFAIKEKFNLLEPLKIMPYYGFGSAHYIFIKGRVLEEEKVKEKNEEGSTLQHLKNTYKRYESDEIPHIKVSGEFAGKKIETETDDEGFFEFEFQFDEPVDYEKHGKIAKFRLLETKTEDDDREAEGKIFVPDKDCEFGIISDIDDTVLISKMTHFLAKLKLMLLNNSTERSPFPGIGAFLRALRKGYDDKGYNPVFYVSGSEWNIFDLLVNFIQYHDIPEGPLFLKNKGTKEEEGKVIMAEKDYKREKIRHILETFPDMKFICIGDSGQEDPEIYQKVQEEFPEQIIGIYIRDVTPDDRDREVHKIKEEVEANGAEMLLIEETFSAAEHAAKMKWINEDQLEEIKKGCEEDQKGSEK